MSAADFEYLLRREGAMVSGDLAAIEFGELLQAEGGGDLYVSAELAEGIASLVAAVPSRTTSSQRSCGGVGLQPCWPSSRIAVPR